jgi:predicted Fe-Mo cluster-binding NifX family protein
VRKLKVCITATGRDLNTQIDPRFGRAQNFLIVDANTMECEPIENPAITAGGGAGIQAAQLVANKGAEAVLTGHVGPNAFNTLQAAGIKIYVGITGTAKEAIEKFNSKQLQPITAPSVGAHFGMKGAGAGR